MKNIGLKTILFASACALATVSSMAEGASTPFSNLSGYGEIFAGYGYGTEGSRTDVYTDGSLFDRSRSRDQNDLSTLGASGHVNMDLSPSWGLQIDAMGHDIATGNDNETVGGFGAHLYHRTDDTLLGGFVSFGSALGSRFATIGADSKIFTDDLGIKDMSADFQASYTAAIQGSLEGQRADSWNLYTGVNYFYTPRLKFAAGAGVNWLNMHDHIGAAVENERFHHNMTNVNWNAEVEYQLKDSPLSVFAKYQGAYGSNIYTIFETGDHYTNSTEVRGNMVEVGLRVYFGGNTLEDNDRHGAVFSDHNPIYGNSLL